MRRRARSCALASKIFLLAHPGKTIIVPISRPSAINPGAVQEIHADGVIMLPSLTRGNVAACDAVLPTVSVRISV